MDVFILMAVCIFGAVFGSFLNVLIYRLPTERKGLSPLKPAYSFCPSCKSRIKWFDNIPIISFLVLNGRCRNCKSQISIRYPLVELLTITLFGICAIYLIIEKEEWLKFFVYLYLSCILIVITFIDLEFEEIPYIITTTGIIAAPIISILVPSLHSFKRLPEFVKIIVSPESARFAGLVTSIFGMAVGFATLFVVRFVGTLIARREAMGYGDVKFLTLVGGFLGWDGALLVFFIGCVAGSIIGILIMISKKLRTSRIPFGPYLALGVFLVMFFKVDIIYFLFTIYPRWIKGIFSF